MVAFLAGIGGGLPPIFAINLDRSFFLGGGEFQPQFFWHKGVKFPPKSLSFIGCGLSLKFEPNWISLIF